LRPPRRRWEAIQARSTGAARLDRRAAKWRLAMTGAFECNRQGMEGLMKKTGVALALILVTTAPVSVFAQAEKMARAVA